tara:strand:+ start:1394 stop:2605 length:1212 start_codon:yes stop_codon:yes gene_type:complete
MVGAAYGGKIIKYDWSGDIIWEYAYADTNHLQHHDIEPMSNGNLLVLSWDRKTYLEALSVGRENIESEMWPDKIVELQPQGYNDAAVIWEWTFWDHLIQDYDSTLSNFGVVANHPELLDINLVSLDLAALGYCDWTHSNSIDYNEELDQILISCRNLHEIYIIDHSTTTQEASGHTGGNSGMGGDILYRWGNPMNYGRGQHENRMLIGQHDANWISSDYPGGSNIIIYNNGSITTFGQDFTQSSVVEIEPPLNEFGLYDIDEVHSFAPLSYNWEYTGDFFSHIMSGVRRLENGNSIVTAATEMRIFEVTSEGNIVWDYIHNEVGQNSISKAFKYPMDYMRTGGLLFGDNNYDENTDIFDIIIIINHILDITQLELSQLYVSDINHDGDVSVQDIIQLISIILE